MRGAGRGFAASALDVELVIAAVEVQGGDVEVKTGLGDSVKGGVQERRSLRLAPSMAHPMGRPCPSGGDPFVAAGPQGRVRHLTVEDGFDIDPRGAGDQTDRDSSKADPVRNPGPVTAQRMGPIG